MNSQTTSAELQSLKNLEPQAWRSVYDSCASSVFQFIAKNYGGDADFAQEVTQETFSRAMESINRFKGEDAAIATWLIAIARKTATRMKPNLEIGGVKVVSLEHFQDAKEPEDDSKDPGELLVGIEEEGILLLALEKLPIDWKKSLVLKYWDGCSVKQIGRALGTTKKGAEGILARARRGDCSWNTKSSWIPQRRV